MRACTITFATHIGEELDFLSFLTQVLAYVVDFAKTVAGLAAIMLIFMLIRCLPTRIRKFVSTFATMVIAFALFKSSVQYLGLFVTKTLIIHLAVVGIVTATVAIRFVVNSAAEPTPHGHLQGRLIFSKAEKGDFRRVYLRDTLIASNSYLQISPVIIQ